MIKKIILSLIAFICLFGIMYSADFEAKSLFTNIINPLLAIAADASICENIPPECVPPISVIEEGECAIAHWYLEHPKCLKYKDCISQPEEEEAPVEHPSTSSECQLFYVKKEEVNKCIETLKGSNVYESDFEGRKVESMMIIPGI